MDGGICCIVMTDIYKESMVADNYADLALLVKSCQGIVCKTKTEKLAKCQAT